MYQKPDFLSDYEFNVLRLTNDGKSVEEIVESLFKSEVEKIHQQNIDEEKKRKEYNKFINRIYKTKVVVRKKIERELRRTATSLRLDPDITNIPKDAGLLIGFDWKLNTKVNLIFTAEKGILAWWEHECNTDNCQQICQESLDLIRRERKIRLPPDQEKLSLLQQFQFVISKIQVRR